jgi:hypothetical protein
MSLKNESSKVKNIFYAAVGTLLYIAPLVTIWVQIQGGKMLREELKGIKEAIQLLKPQEFKDLTIDIGSEEFWKKYDLNR